MNYWSFSRILLYWKCISENKKKRKKTYPTGLGRARGPDPTRSGPAVSPHGPIWARPRPQAKAAEAPPPPLLVWALGIPWGSALLFNACPSSCSRPRGLRPRAPSSAQGAATGVDLAVAAHDLPLPSTFEPSQHHQELQAVALHLLNSSSSPPQRRSATAPCGSSRPPWLAVAGHLSVLLCPRWRLHRVPLELLFVFAYLREHLAA
jgi:hypothetical protein